jgi:hypothetical protein
MPAEHPVAAIGGGEAADCTRQRDKNYEEIAGQDDEHMTEKKSETLIVSQAQSRSQLGSRGALLAGFGALLVLMAIICIDSLRTLGAFATYNTQIRQELLYRERTLEQVRAGLYGTSNIDVTIS